MVQGFHQAGSTEGKMILRKYCPPLLSAVLIVFAFSAQAASLDSIQNKVNSIDSKVTTVNNRTSSINTTVNGLTNKMNDLSGTVQSSLSINIDTELKDTILTGIATAQTALATQKQNILDFGDGSFGTGCYDTREFLKGLTTDTVDVRTMLESIGTSAIPPPPDSIVAQMLQLIDQLDCKILMPAGLTLVASGITDITDELSEIRGALEAILPLFDPSVFNTSVSTTTADLSANNVSSLSSSNFSNALQPITFPAVCELIDAGSTPMSRGVYVLEKISIILQIAGAKLSPDELEGGGPIASSVKLGEQIVGIHGYAGIKLKPPEAKAKLSGNLTFYGEILGLLAGMAAGKIDGCTSFINQQRLLENQQAIFAEICGISRYRSVACQALL